MANPFDKFRDGDGGPPKTDLRAWCEAQNRTKLAERMSRWYFVTEKDGSKLIDSLDGTDGENVRRLLDGNLPDFHGWSEKRMQGYRRWLWNCAVRGLTEETAARLGRTPALEPA